MCRQPMLYTDSKLAVRTLASRIGPLQNQVEIPLRQTFFRCAGQPAGTPGGGISSLGGILSSQVSRSSWTSRRPSTASTAPGSRGVWQQWASGLARSDGCPSCTPARRRASPSKDGTPMSSRWRRVRIFQLPRGRLLEWPSCFQDAGKAVRSFCSW